MNQLNELTTDQLISIITNRSPIDGVLLAAANAELIRRINGNKQTINTLIDVPAIEKEVQHAQCLIKELHERCDQAVKKILELEERSKPLGILSNGDGNMTLTHLAGWSDKEMVDFAMRCLHIFNEKSHVGYDVELAKYIKEKHAQNH